MSDNGFSRVYGLAPPEEEWIAPPPVTPPPVEQAAPSGNGFVDVYGLSPPPRQAAPAPAPASAPPPTNYQPGSTYVPPAERSPSVERPVAAPQTETVPVPPGGVPVPPDNRPIWERATETIIPQLVSDAGKSVEEFRAQPSLTDKVGQGLGAFNVLPEKVQNRVEQRLEDRQKYGDPDRTLGGMGLDGGIQGVWNDPSTLLDLPAAIGEIKDHPEVLVDSMAMDVAESAGGFDQGKQSFADWATTHPKEFAEARAQGEGEPTRKWMEDTGRTLASGGSGGAMSGLGYEAGTDPSTPASLGGGLLATGAKNVVGLAGRAGLAGGLVVPAQKLISKVDAALQIAIDPGGMALESGARRLLNKATGGLTGLTPEAEQAKRTGILNEVMGGASQSNLTALRAQQAADAAQAQTAAPTGSVPSTNGTVPPITPLVPPSGAGIAPQPVNGSAPPSPAPLLAPPLAPVVVPPAPQPASPPLNLYPTPSPAPTTPGGLPIAMGRGPFGVERHTVGDFVIDFRKMPNGEMRWSVRHKSGLGKSDQARSGGLLEGVPGMRGESFNSYDEAVANVDARSGRKAPASPAVPRGSTGAPFGARPVTQDTAAAKLPLLMRDSSRPQGSRWVHPNGQAPTKAALLQGWKAIREAPPEQIKGFSPGADVLPGEDTVFTQYLAAMTEQGHLYNDWPMKKTGGTKEQRASGQAWTRLFSERIERHGAPEVQRLVDEYHAQQKMPYYQGKNVPNPGKYWEWRAEAIIEAATKAEFDTPFTLKRGIGTPYPYTPKGGASSASPIRSTGSLLAPTRLVIDDPIAATNAHFITSPRKTRNDRAWDLQRIMDNADGFSPDSPELKALRNRFYESRAWSQVEASNPDGYARYQAVRDLHAMRHGPTLNSQGMYRRGSYDPALSPTQRLDTIDGLMRGDHQSINVIDAVAKESRAHLDAMGLGHVRLRYTDFIDSETGDLAPFFGQFDPGSDEISLAVQYTADAVVDEIDRTLGGVNALISMIDSGEFATFVKHALHQTMNHEALHALRAARVITDVEWKLLVTEARKRGYGQWAMDAYGPNVKTGKQLYEQENVFEAMTTGFDQYDEEAVAEMFGNFALDQTMLSGVTRTTFQKITDFFSGLVRAVLRQENGVDVMKQMLSGDVGARTPLTSPVNPYTGDTRYYQKGKFTGALQRAAGIGPRSTAVHSMDMSLITEEDPVYHLLDAGPRAMMATPIDYNGKPTTLMGMNADVVYEVDELKNLARAQATATTVDPFPPASLARLNALKKLYAPYEPRYDWADPAFDETELARIAGDHTTALWSAKEFPPGTPKDANAISSAGQLLKDTTAFRRKMGLTNFAAAPRQFFLQLVGNFFMAGAANPAAIFRMWDPRSYRSVFRAAGRKQAYTDVEAFEVVRKRGAPHTVNTSKKSLAKYDVAIKNPTLKRLTNVFSRDWVADMVSTPDGVARGAAFGAKKYPAMRKELAAAPRMGSETYASYLKKHGIDMVALHPKQVEEVIAGVIKSNKHLGEPHSRASGQDLKDALIDKFMPDAAGDPAKVKNLRDFADRVGRNLNTADNLHSQYGQQAVDKVFFPWDTTRIDEAASNVFLYLYWSSRASFLYAKEAVKKPWMAAAMINLTGQLQDEAEEHNYPEWMKGFTRLLNTPAGFTLFANPIDAVSTMLVLGDWQYGENMMEAMKGDLTMLGAAQSTLFPVMAPWLQFGAYVAGFFGGEDARLPSNLTGLDQIPRRGAQILNGLGYAGLLPLGMGRDASGQFRPFGEMPLAELAMKASVFLGRPPIDLYAGSVAKKQMELQTILLEDHPEWGESPEGENELTRTANAMWEDALAGDVAPEIYEAEQRMTQSAVSGIDIEAVPEPLREMFGIVSRVLSPVRMMAEPTIKTQIREGDVPVGVGDEYDVKDLKGSPYDTLDAALLAAQSEDWWDIGADTGMDDAYRVYNQLANANFDGVINVYGKAYTKSSLQDGVMTEGQRYDVADEYLESQGLTRKQLDEFKAAREEMLNLHPDLGGYMEYKSYIESYPGEIKGFVDAAVRTSPSFARYMQQTGKQPGSEEYYEAATYTDAFFAIEGRRSGIYDPTTLPPAGTIPGLPSGSTFAMQRALGEVVDAAAATSGGGDGDTYEEFVGDVEGKVADAYYGQYWLDQTFPGSGLRAGIDRLPYDMYQVMLGVWKEKNVYVPDEGDIAYEYTDWLAANATAPDHSVKAFLDQREQTGPGKSADMPPPTPEQIAAQRGIELVTSGPAPRTAGGSIDTTGMRKVRTNQEIWMHTGPSWNNPQSVSLFAGMPNLWVSDISDDKQWVQVIAPGNQVGWIPAQALNQA